MRIFSFFLLIDGEVRTVFFDMVSGCAGLELVHISEKALVERGFAGNFPPQVGKSYLRIIPWFFPSSKMNECDIVGCGKVLDEVVRKKLF